MRSHRTFVRGAAVLVSSLVALGSATGAALAHGHGQGRSNSGHGHKGALYVSPSGKTGAADRNCKSAAYSSVQSAVAAAPSGGTVVVCRGTYTEDVIVSAPLTLTGEHGAVIHGSSTANGMCDQLGTQGPGQRAVPCRDHDQVKRREGRGPEGHGRDWRGDPRDRLVGRRFDQPRDDRG